ARISRGNFHAAGRFVAQHAHEVLGTLPGRAVSWQACGRIRSAPLMNRATSHANFEPAPEKRAGVSVGEKTSRRCHAFPRLLTITALVVLGLLIAIRWAASP